MGGRVGLPVVTEMADSGGLVAGCHLYPVADGSWRCVSPDGRYMRLRGSEDLLRRLQQHLYGYATDPGVVAEAGQLVERLRSRGLLEDATADGVRAVRDRVVGIEGDGPVADLTASLLAGSVRVVRGRLSAEVFATVDMAVSCAGWLPDRRWQQIDRWSLEYRVPWHRVHAEGDRFVVGPCSWPGRTASYADTRARRLAAAGLPDELAAYWSYLDSGVDSGVDSASRAVREPPAAAAFPSPGCAGVLAGLLVDDIVTALTGRPMPFEGTQLTVDRADLTIRRHPVLPLPAAWGDGAGGPGGSVETGDGNAGFTATERLVDPRVGLITGVVRDHAPAGTMRSCVGYTARVADTRQIGPFSADRETSGAAFCDEDAARRAAVGEAVERYCGNVPPKQVRHASSARLRAAGRRTVDPVELALFSDRQYRSPGFPFVPLTPHLDVDWVSGDDLADGAETLVPASLVHLNHAVDQGQRPTNVQPYAGIAAGTSVASATRAALEELLERDAVTLWWLSGAPAMAVVVPSGCALAHDLADPDAAGLDITLVRIPSTFGVPVLGAYLVDPQRDVVALGTACRSTATAAARKAVTEAVGSYRLSLRLLDPSWEFWRAVEDGRIEADPYRPLRGDRRYRDSYRSDWRDVHDLSMHLQIYLDPRMQHEHLGRLAKPAGEVRLADLPELPAESVTVYQELLHARGFRPVIVDLTTRDVAAAGMHVVRAVVPGLYGTAPAAFPSLGGRRLYQEPAEHGWLSRPLTEDEVVRAPVPFA